MRLHDWCEREGRGSISRVASQAKLAYSTVHLAVRGNPIKTYDVAKAISDATGGEVSIAELCEPEPAPLVGVEPSSNGAASEPEAAGGESKCAATGNA